MLQREDSSSIDYFKDIQLWKDVKALLATLRTETHPEEKYRRLRKLDDGGRTT